MYIDKANVKQNGKIYVRYLLRESYRKNGKVKHRTIGCLSRCSEKEIAAMKLALKHKNNLSVLKTRKDGENKIKIKSKQGLSVGSIILLKGIAERLKITEVLGKTQEGKLALWQIMARIIDQGSRLSAVRLAGKHAICDLLDMESFNEEDLYENLNWLSEHQRDMEKRLYELRYKKKGEIKLYLYDVTSSYLEGVKNELGAWGYNRDGKKGKMQIVIGLLTDEEGEPISVEVFKGNTSDVNTFLSQIKKLANDFGIKEVTMVGDRGMIKSGQIEDLRKENFHYITALTKPQIEKLIKEKTIQIELFDEKICEVEKDNIRYILRRNPVRVEEIEKNRESKIKRIKKKIEEQNRYLREHEKAEEAVSLRNINNYIKQLKLEDYVEVKLEKRKITVFIDKGKKEESVLLDGCYVIKTDLEKDQAIKETVHQRYKDLAEVEQGFRTMKTGLLETRPIYVRKESRTRGHVFVVMLSYSIIRQLKELWKEIDLTIEECLNELNTICSIKINVKGVSCWQIPEPREMGLKLLSAANISLPEVLPNRGVIVATKKKLINNRK